MRFKANNKFYTINLSKEIVKFILDTNKIRNKELSERQKNMFEALYKKLNKKNKMIKLKKYQEGGKNGLNVGAEKHLSSVEQNMYKSALKTRNKEAIKYFESKINKGLILDNKKTNNKK